MWPKDFCWPFVSLLPFIIQTVRWVDRKHTIGVDTIAAEWGTQSTDKANRSDTSLEGIKKKSWEIKHVSCRQCLTKALIPAHYHHQASAPQGLPQLINADCRIRAWSPTSKQEAASHTSVKRLYSDPHPLYCTTQPASLGMFPYLLNAYFLNVKHIGHWAEKG